jgi:hypothetical protein
MVHGKSLNLSFLIHHFPQQIPGLSTFFSAPFTQKPVLFLNLIYFFAASNCISTHPVRKDFQAFCWSFYRDYNMAFQSFLTAFLLKRKQAKGSRGKCLFLRLRISVIGFL